MDVTLDMSLHLLAQAMVGRNPEYSRMAICSARYFLTSPIYRRALLGSEKQKKILDKPYALARERRHSNERADLFQFMLYVR
jgi:hypothetical protein